MYHFILGPAFEPEFSSLKLGNLDESLAFGTVLLGFWGKNGRSTNRRF